MSAPEVKSFRPITCTDFVHEMVSRGLIPPGTTRFIIDSGNPDGVVRIYWSAFADVDLLEAIFNRVLTPDKEVNA